MIYFAGFYNWEQQFGTLLSIANTEPDGFKGYTDRLHFFVPQWKDVSSWKKSCKTDEDWKHFVSMYRIVCRQRWVEIDRWLNSLTPETDMTLLCWEPRSQRCHRSLAAKFVEVYRPDCYGGLDVQNPARKVCVHKNVRYKIEVCDCPWSAGFAFSVTAPGGGICACGDRSDYPYLKGVYALPEHAIEAATEFIKNGQ